MIWIIVAVGLALLMLVVMSKRAKEDDDPVWLTVLAVDRLADEIARWETNLWSLWAVALIENLFFRLDEFDRRTYLDKVVSQVGDLQNDLWGGSPPMSEKEVDFLSRIDDLQTP